DLVSAPRRRVLRVVDQLAHVVDAGVARGIDLEQVHEAACVDLGAGTALAARLRGRSLLAVERLGEDARDRRLADAARAGEQERMMQPPAVERVRERAHDVLLADQFGKATRAPLAREGLVRHRGSTDGWSIVATTAGTGGRVLRPPCTCLNQQVSCAARPPTPMAVDAAADAPEGRSAMEVRTVFGEVSEWLKEHAWKVCKRVKPFRGFESRP